jgi:hypothetical protein
MEFSRSGLGDLLANNTSEYSAQRIDDSATSSTERLDYLDSFLAGQLVFRKLNSIRKRYIYRLVWKKQEKFQKNMWYFILFFISWHTLADSSISVKFVCLTMDSNRRACSSFPAVGSSCKFNNIKNTSVNTVKKKKKFKKEEEY